MVKKMTMELESAQKKTPIEYTLVETGYGAKRRKKNKNKTKIEKIKK